MMLTQTAEQFNHEQAGQQKFCRYKEESKILFFPTPAQKSTYCKSIVSAHGRVLQDDSAKHDAEDRSGLMSKRSKVQQILACFIIASLISVGIVFGGVIIFDISPSMRNATELFSVYAGIQTLTWGILLVRS